MTTDFPAATLRKRPPEVRRAAVLDALRTEIGRTLDVDPDFLEEDAPLPDLGLDSLALVSLAERVQAWAGVAVPLALLPMTGTLDEVARTVADALGTSDPAAALREAAAGRVRAAVAADLYLLDGTGSAAEAVSAAEAAEPRRVLLTGATGFVGAHLLHALLEETGARVHCLVRADSAEAGLGRLRENLARFDLPRDALAARVVVEPGDLAAPRLGLPPERYDELARELDLIYHNGAAVHLTQTYEEARGANVEGTRTILHLAGTGRCKPVAVVSTVGLFDTPELEGRESIAEGDGARDVASLPNGYTRSKWAGERLVERARAAGVPAATLRVGHVIGHGVSDDLAARLVRAAVASGAVPALERPVDYVSPGYVARAIARLPRDEGFGGVYHLANPAPLDAADQATLLVLVPAPLTVLPAREWVARLREAARADVDHPLAPAIDALEVPVGEGGAGEGGASFVERVLRRPRIDCARTGRALEGTGIACPPARDVFVEVVLGMPELRAAFAREAAAATG